MTQVVAALRVADPDAEGGYRTLSLQDLIDVFVTALADAAIDIGDVNLNTDQVEAKLDTAHADLAAILAKDEAIRALQQAILDALGSTLLVESALGDYTETNVTTGPAAGLPATRTYTTGPLAGKTTTWTYNATTGAVESRTTA